MIIDIVSGRGIKLEKLRQEKKAGDIVCFYGGAEYYGKYEFEGSGEVVEKNNRLYVDSNGILFELDMLKECCYVE